MRYLSKKEILEGLQKAYKSKVHAERNYIIISVLAKTGVRVSELIHITTNDILTDSKQIIIRGKGDKIRNVDVSMDIILQLQGYAQKKKIPKNKPIIKLTRQAIWLITKRLAETNPHSFRHSYTIELLQKTKNIRYVQKQLGHSDIRVTEIYLQYMEFDEDKKEVERLWT